MNGNRRRTFTANSRSDNAYTHDRQHFHDRRQTVAGSTLLEKSRKSVGNTNFRVNKSKDSRVKKQPRFENHHSTLQNQLDRYKANLISTLNNDLSEIDAKLTESMSNLSTQFGSRCSIIEESALRATHSLDKEIFVLSDKDDDTNPGIQFGEHMATFTQLFESSKEKLANLWSEYEQTQTSIMELALVILDEDNVRFTHDRSREGQGGNIDERRAARGRKEAQDVYDGALDELESLEGQVEDKVAEYVGRNNKILNDYKKQAVKMKAELGDWLQEIQ